MWVLVMLVCTSIAAPSCSLHLYNASFFEDSVPCLAEGASMQATLAEKGLASAAYCFDITEIGKSEAETPNL
jgi:hypothetical protein